MRAFASSLILCVVVAVVVVSGFVGCRNDIVGEPPLPDAGFEGEGEGSEGEGEGEGEACHGGVPAISVRIEDDTGFIICTADAVTLTDGEYTEVAVVVRVGGEECRHQGGFRRPGTYDVTIAVDGFVTRQVPLTAVAGGNACGDPVTTSLSLALRPQ